MQDAPLGLVPVFLRIYHAHAAFLDYGGHTFDERPDTVSNNQDCLPALVSTALVASIIRIRASCAIGFFEPVGNQLDCNAVVLDCELLKKSVDSIYSASSFSRHYSKIIKPYLEITSLA